MAGKGGAKVVKPKLGKSEATKPHKPKQTPVKPDKCDVPLAGEVAPLQAPAVPDLDVTKLPLHWQVFVEKYLIDLNGTQAAIRAGYSAKWARQIGTENKTVHQCRHCTVGEMQASGGCPGPGQGFASSDLMVSPSLKNDAKVNIENEKRKLCQPSKLSKI